MHDKRTAVMIAIAWIAATCFMIEPACAADDWATIVAKAKQEGVVAVHGAPGRGYATALDDAFHKSYPDIKVAFAGESGGVSVPKILRERQAGLYNWDAWIGGADSALQRLRPVGFFDPLRPILRPETTADDKWTGGFESGWADTAKSLFYCFDGTTQDAVKVNWDVVTKTQLTSLADLETPKFAGKIVWHDPRVRGTGNGTSQTLLHNLGEAGLIKVYQNGVVYSRNSEQIAEWVVRGRYPVGIGLDEDALIRFQQEGIGKNVTPLPNSYYKVEQISPGFGCVGVVNHAPHKDAAIVYVNWLLSKAGQEAWTKIPRNSRRTDVAPSLPGLQAKPGVKYFNGEQEIYHAERKHLVELANKVIAASSH
jgi:iron(III) transport system substrate-binding protein